MNVLGDIKNTIFEVEHIFQKTVTGPEKKAIVVNKLEKILKKYTDRDGLLDMFLEEYLGDLIDLIVTLVKTKKYHKLFKASGCNKFFSCV